MTEQIYINGSLMDQSDNKGMSLIYQSPLFTDIDSIVSNRTNSVNFPATKKNLAAIDNCHMSGSGSKFAYRRHSVQYYRDGIQVFTGYGTLLSISPDTIKFTFTWGNSSAFQKLLDVKLRDLQTENDYADLYNATEDGSEHFDYSFNFGYAGGLRHPYLKVSEILERVEKRSGITIENKDLFAQYVLPIMSRYADDFTKKKQGLLIKTGTYHTEVAGTVVTARNDYLCPSSSDSDVGKLYTGANGVYNVEAYDKVRVCISKGFQYRVLNNDGRQYIGISGLKDEGYKTLKKVSVDRKISGSYCYCTVPEEEDFVLDVSDCTHLRILLNTRDGVWASAEPKIMTGEFSLSTNPDSEEEVKGRYFPLYYNLPDWTASQLLKNLMKLEAAFPACTAERTVRMVSMQEVYDRRENAVDWTDKLILDKGIGSELAGKFGSYARQNHCKYADDETVKGNHDGVLRVDNDTLDAETDLITLDFAACDNDCIPLYSKDENNQAVYNSGLMQRILRMDGINSYDQTETTFRGLDWENLLETKYYTYQQALLHPKTLKASVLLNTIDLAKLDLTIPVYSYQLGHHYAIMKLTTKENNMAEVELLQLGEIKEKQVYVEEDLEELAVLQNAAGEYYATFPSWTDAMIAKFVESNQYKVCLLRYGYARRGKAFKYINKYGVETTSRCARNYKYKKYRRRAQWRIIGEDILLRGALPRHSQTADYYGDSTLVFNLLEPIKLPPMRANRKRLYTKAGRIKNKSRDGLTELFIAVLQKKSLYGYNGGWEIVSNIVQVRGTNNNCSELWEFSKDNVVM